MRKLSQNSLIFSLLEKFLIEIITRKDPRQQNPDLGIFDKFLSHSLCTVEQIHNESAAFTTMMTLP